jgi:uncharacterized protein DUF4406
MRVYIAGPITKGDQFLNLRRALEVATDIRAKGHIPFIPHLTCIWHMIFPSDYEDWLMFDFAWIEVCDALFRMPGESPGADREVAYATKLEKKVFYSMDDLPHA